MILPDLVGMAIDNLTAATVHCGKPAIEREGDFMVRLRTTRRLAGVVILFVTVTASAEPPAPPSAPKSDPITSYEVHKLQGFKVMLNDRLVGGGQMLRCLDQRLAEIVRVVPAAHLSLLREVTFWIEASDASEPTVPKEHAAAFYVQIDIDRDRARGMLAAKKGGIVILDQNLLLEPEARWAHEACPGFLLHEVAHALEDRLVGLEHAQAKDAYRLAIERKRYDAVNARVIQHDGRFITEVMQAYARTNCAEYFAELSAAYLGMPTSFLPWSRDELRQRDPDGFKLMEGFWRNIPSTAVNDFPFPVTIDRVAETGRRFRLFDLVPGQEKAFDGWTGMSLIATDAVDGTEYRFPNRADGRWRLRAAP